MLCRVCCCVVFDICVICGALCVLLIVIDVLRCVSCGLCVVDGA